MSDTGSPTILSTEGLTKRFGGLCAVDGIDLEVTRGRIHSLIGPNGAGKTTAFNLLTGVEISDAGRVLFNGEDVTALPLHAMARRGLARSFQRTQLFPALTAFENVRLARQGVGSGRLSAIRLPEERPSSDGPVAELLDFVGLAGRYRDAAEVLAHGEQRALDIAVALASDPQLLLLDEPTSGMSAGEVGAVIELVGRLRDEANVTVLVVEHNIELVMAVSDVITVLHEGRILAHGRPEEIRESRPVIEAYLGEL